MSAERQGSVDPGIREKISTGALLHFGSSVGVRLLGILTVAVLGRLLTPADFGIFAYAVFVSTLTDSCFYRHFHFSLVRLPQVTEKHLDTLFTLRLLTGLIIAGGIALCAKPVAVWVDAPELYDVLNWIAIAQIIGTFSSPRFMLLEKELRFAPAAFQILLVRTLTTCSAIALGFAWGNYWALVTGLVLMPIITLLHSHWIAPYRPRLSLVKWHAFLRFGLWVMFGNLFNFLSIRVDRLLLGPFAGIAAVGIYRMGVDLAELGTQQFAQPMERVIYPALATKGQDKSSLRNAYLETQSVVIGVVLPMGLLTALSASEIIRIVAGPDWLAAAPVMWVLAPLIALTTLEGGVRALIYIKDAPEKIFFRNLLIFCVAMPLLIAGVTLGGFEGVILASAGVKIFALILTLRLADKATNTSFFAPFLRAWRSFFAGAAMILALAVVIGWGPSTTADTSVSAATVILAFKASLGISIYLAMHFLLWALSGCPNGIESLSVAFLRRVKSRILRLYSD